MGADESPAVSEVVGKFPWIKKTKYVSSQFSAYMCS